MKKKTTVLFLLRIFKSIFTIVILSLSARYFGVSVERDTWLLAMNCILVLDLAIWGPINETFRAKFIFLREEIGESEALKMARSLFLFTNLVTVILGLIFFLFPRLLTSFIAPSFSGEKLELLILLIKILIPSFLINQCIQLCASLLNSYSSFYVPEISGIISSVANIVLLILTAKTLGIYALAAAYYIGIFIYATLLIIEIQRKGIKIFQYSPVFLFRDVKPFVIYSLPFFIPYFSGQISLVVEKSIASTLDSGIVSSIDYSRKFMDMPLSVLSSVLTTILVPTLSVSFAAGKIKDFIEYAKSTLHICLLILAALVSVLYCCSFELAQILYGASLGSSTIRLIASLTSAYSLSALAIFIYLLFGVVLLSMNKGKIYATYGVVAQIIMIFFNISMYKLIGIYVFPLSLFLAHLIAAIFMSFKVPYGRKQLLGSIVTRVVIVAIVISILSALTSLLSFKVIDSPLLLLLLKMSMSFSLIITLSFIFKLEESRVIKDILFKLIGRIR